MFKDAFVKEILELDSLYKEWDSNPTQGQVGSSGWGFLVAQIWVSEGASRC